MAIAITLLALDVRMPEEGAAGASDFTRRVLKLWPKYIGYVVSFWVSPCIGWPITVAFVTSRGTTDA
jgi:uncharacterized membrane protein